MKIQTVHVYHVHVIAFERLVNKFPVHLLTPRTQVIVKLSICTRSRNQFAFDLRSAAAITMERWPASTSASSIRVSICSEPPTASGPTSVSG